MPAQSGGPDDLAAEIVNCRICRDRPRGARLPHEPRPVLQVGLTATLCIAGQAPGVRVHKTGIPFNDPSGDRLRQWIGVDHSVFYDKSRIAIVPMGFCFPGQDKSGGDLPPRTECAANWHDALYARLPNLRAILAIGRYAQAYHLGAAAKAGVYGNRPQLA